MSETDFWDNEVWAVLNRIDAWGKKYEQQEKGELQRISLLGSWMLNPYSKKGKPIKPQDLLPAVWEGINTSGSKGPLSAEERAKIFAKHDAIARKNSAMARADLNVRLGVITRNFEKSLKRAERSLRRSAQQMSDIGSSLTAAVSLPVAGVGVASLRAAGDIEALEKGLKAILPPSASVSDELERLRRISELPGLGFEQAVQGSVRLQSIGLNADQSAASLEAFGRIVALTGGGAEKLDSVVNQFTQINSKGKLLAEDLNVIRENASGFNIALQDAFGTTNIEAIRETGISTGEFTKRIVEAVQQSKVFQEVQGGLSNSFENARVSVRLFLSELGKEINRLFDVQGATEQFSLALGRLSAAFKSLDDEQKKNIIRFAALAAAIGPALIIFGKLLTILRFVPIALTAILGPVEIAYIWVLGCIAGVYDCSNQGQNSCCCTSHGWRFVAYCCRSCSRCYRWYCCCCRRLFVCH